MDQVITDGIQHLQLTKEEEEEISISTVRSDLLDECTLSLFGQLLADGHLNMRAFKSTLRSAWKMGSDLRIVDVEKNVFQWRKGLSVDNILFTHSPFWIQIWGLPFESMTEVGKELGNKLGKYIQSDRRSWSEEQAKFMRMRVEVPIDKPLRRGGNIVNPEGEKYWVTFKYGRLPNFCFICGVLGHDEKHCSEYQGKSECHRQYENWIRPNSGFKGVFEKQKAASRGGSEERMEENSGVQHSPMTTGPTSLSAE
nr:uncharacterized protein CFP56_31247 [Quercus suber]